MGKKPHKSGKIWALDGKIDDRDVQRSQYRVSYIEPRLRVKMQTWVKVDNLTSLNEDREKIRPRYNAMTSIIQAANQEDTERKWMDNAGDFAGHRIVFNPLGDGAWQFSALSHQLAHRDRGIVTTARKLRELTIDYLEENMQHEIVDFLEDNDVDTYLSEMRHATTFGDHFTLLAVSRLLQINIYIVSSSGDRRMVDDSNNYATTLCI